MSATQSLMDQVMSGDCANFIDLALAYAATCGWPFSPSAGYRVEDTEEYARAQHHLAEKARAEAEAHQVRFWSAPEAIAQSLAAHTAIRRVRAETNPKQRLKRSRLENMLDEVTAWEPPIPQLQPFKRGLIEAITTAIHDDCVLIDDHPRAAGPDYKQQRLAAADREVSYHAGEYDRLMAAAHAAVAKYTALHDNLEGLRAAAATANSTPLAEPNPPDCSCEFVHRSSATCRSAAPSRGAIVDAHT